MVKIRSPPQLPAGAAGDEIKLGPLALRLISQRADSRLWSEYIARYHYLGRAAPGGLALLRRQRQEAAQQLPHDWPQRYGYQPVLLETFVESRLGKRCPIQQPIVPIKDIWPYPLRRDFAAVLGR